MVSSSANITEHWIVIKKKNGLAVMVAMVLVNCEEKNLQSKLKNNNYKFKITFHFLLCFQFFIINLFFFVGITSICSSPFSCIKFPKFENRNENWTGEIKPIFFSLVGISYAFLSSFFNRRLPNLLTNLKFWNATTAE